MAVSPFYVPPPISLTVLGKGLDLEATLTSGQSFSWKLGPSDRWYGWVGGWPCVVWEQGDVIRAIGPGLTIDALNLYFGLDRNWDEMWMALPQDEFLQKARAVAPGLRLLKQDPWETICNFICSSQKRVVQIEQINREIRTNFGDEIQPGWHTFPPPERLANATVERLRECKTGYRADYLHKAAIQIYKQQVSLEKIAQMPTPAALEELRKLAGVGEKVANCVLLFAYARMEAFPVDVWVERALTRLYFKGKKTVSLAELRAFVAKHFGAYGGYAQQFLFHWIRNNPDALPAEHHKRPTQTLKRRPVKRSE